MKWFKYFLCFFLLFCFFEKGWGQCLDFTNLHAPNVTATIGKVSVPYLTKYVCDYGPQSRSSRHTVHTDISERDIRTGFLLSTVPPGKTASVRLGNWDINMDAESISYKYLIDTNVFKILLIEYAVVLQDPSHPIENQPRFVLEILDEKGKLIDSKCGKADFSADINLGWNVSWDIMGTVLWKDWTNIAFNVSDYHGQSISIRFTTYDCAEGMHYGYAYFTLDCVKSDKIVNESCNSTTFCEFSAPAGFNYQWYSSADMSTIFSTNQKITVPSDGTTVYYCDIAFKDDPSCFFTQTVLARNPVPIARFDYEICNDFVLLKNTSFQSYDGINPIDEYSSCETAYWDFGDGQSSDIYQNPTVKYATEGAYTITLVSGIQDNACSDTMRAIVPFVFSNSTLSITGDTLVCSKTAATLSSDTRYHYQWSTQDTTRKITVFPEINTTYQLTATDARGCQETAQFNVFTLPVHKQHRSFSTCPNDTFSFEGKNLSYSTPGTFTDSVVYTSSLLCDSIIYAHTTVLSPYHTTLYDDACIGTLYSKHGFHFTPTEERDYTEQLFFKSKDGCDSTVTLQLKVHFPSPPIAISGKEQTCPGDSVTLTVDEKVSYLWSTGDTTREITLACHQPTTLLVTTTDKHGCKENAQHLILLHPTSQNTRYFNTCINKPISFEGKLIAYPKPGIYTDSVVYSSAVGCDSTIYASISVFSPTKRVIVDDVCSGEVYNKNGFIIPPFSEERALFYQSFSDQYGCDSLIELHLTRIDSAVTIFASSEDLCLGPVMLWVNENLQNIQWSTGATTSSITASIADTYSVSVGRGNCKGTRFISLKSCYDMIFLPNTITPTRQDGINDVFKIPLDADDNIALVEISIFDRWGKRVFYSRDKYFSWDGKVKGKVIPNSSFFYTLFVKFNSGEEKTYESTLLVL